MARLILDPGGDGPGGVSGLTLNLMGTADLDRLEAEIEEAFEQGKAVTVTVDLAKPGEPEDYAALVINGKTVKSVLIAS